jgi:predicted Zn-dependent protease with MMP-like domain
MDTDQFASIVDEAIKSIPDDFRKLLNNVDIFIEPMHESGPNLLGLYVGIPQTKRRNYGIGGPLPDKIYIYMHPHLMRSRNIKELRESVKDTVMHEVGHHFGMSEGQIRDAMKK